MEIVGGSAGGSDQFTDSNSATAPKRPPPEKSESLNLRVLVIASFWAVVILLGVPVWLWTTSIHRANLPLEDMLAWAQGKVRTQSPSNVSSWLTAYQACKPSLPLHIAINVPQLQETEALQLVRLSQNALDDLNDFSTHHLRLRLAESIQSLERVNASMPIIGKEEKKHIDHSHQHDNFGEDQVLMVRLTSSDAIAETYSEIESHSNTLDIVYPASLVPTATSSSFSLSSYIARTLQKLYSEEQGMIENILNSGHPSTSQSTQQHRQSKSLQPESAARLANRMARSLKYAETYHITISLFTPAASPSGWDIEEAVAEYMEPLLRSLAVISNFTIDTQVQLHAKFAPSVHQPEFDEETRVWTLREEDLSAFINAAEWPLSPSIGAGPTLNFIIYVPDQARSPLVVKGSQSTSWLIPQWGGVTILNPTDGNQTLPASHLSKESLEPALLTFSNQLLSFMGAPQNPPSLPLQLQTLRRVRATSLLLSASSTMGSLANLTVALPSIAIPETVSAAVETTLRQLRNTCDSLKEGRFQDALEHAKIAEAQAEKGFFEKSMVGQVYFPDEHKVAVYLPLLGPIGVPLVMSAMKEIKRLAAARRASSMAP